MSKRMKPLIALVLAVCLLVSAMPAYGAVASAEEDGSMTTSVTENDLTDESSTDVMETESEGPPTSSGRIRPFAVPMRSTI